jgi:hypothetical protein
VWIIAHELGEFFTTFLRPLLCDSNTVDEYSFCKYMDVVGLISLYSSDLTCAGEFDFGGSSSKSLKIRVSSAEACSACGYFADTALPSVSPASFSTYQLAGRFLLIT